MIINLNELEKIRKENYNKKIVIALGSFDLFHFEHLRFLKDAKKLGDILVVVVKDDISVKLKNKDRPIINQDWRVEIVDSLKMVDYTIMASFSDIAIPIELKYNTNLENWWKLFGKIFDTLRPDIFYFEYNAELQPARECINKFFNTKLISRPRTEMISTSKIIEKIKSSN